MTNLGLSYSAGNGGTTWILILDRDRTRQQLTNVSGLEDFLGYISLSLLGAHVLKKFCIRWELLDGIKEWHIYLHLLEDLNYFIHV